MKIEIIIAPLVVFLLVVALLITAKFYDYLPIKPPACSFKNLTGYPCMACRGTRSFRSLVDGEFIKAIKFNPLAVAGCFFAAAWFGGYLIRKGNPPERSPGPKAAAIITAGLLVLNWIYLILTEHWFP